MTYPEFQKGDQVEVISDSDPYHGHILELGDVSIRRNNQPAVWSAHVIIDANGESVNRIETWIGNDEIEKNTSSWFEDYEDSAGSTSRGCHYFL